VLFGLLIIQWALIRTSVCVPGGDGFLFEHGLYVVGGGVGRLIGQGLFSSPLPTPSPSRPSPPSPHAVTWRVTFRPDGGVRRRHPGHPPAGPDRLAPAPAYPSEMGEHTRQPGTK